jgi:hypothetical protein
VVVSDGEDNQSKVSMRRLREAMWSRGIRVINLGYPSVLKSFMRRSPAPSAIVLIACSFLQYPAVSRADECALYHKRAPVEAVCGSVVGPNERFKDVEVTLTDVQGSVVFRTHSDARGKISFRSVPKRDYMLHAATEGYHEAERQIRVTRAGSQACQRKIAVSLGMSYCQSATYIEGIDKPSDLDADFKRTQ